MAIEYPYSSEPVLTQEQAGTPNPGDTGHGHPPKPPRGSKGKEKDALAMGGGIFQRLQFVEPILTQEQAGTPPIANWLMAGVKEPASWECPFSSEPGPIGASPSVGQLDWITQYTQPWPRIPQEWFVRVLYPLNENSVPPAFAFSGLIILGLLSRGLRVGPLLDGEGGPTFGEMTQSGPVYGAKE